MSASTDLVISNETARGLLSSESGRRPRIYGTLADGGQIVALKSVYYLDKYDCDKIWISMTTQADLVKRA